MTPMVVGRASDPLRKAFYHAPDDTEATPSSAVASSNPAVAAAQAELGSRRQRCPREADADLHAAAGSGYGLAAPAHLSPLVQGVHVASSALLGALANLPPLSAQQLAELETLLPLCEQLASRLQLVASRERHDTEREKAATAAHKAAPRVKKERRRKTNSTDSMYTASGASSFSNPALVEELMFAAACYVHDRIIAGEDKAAQLVAGGKPRPPDVCSRLSQSHRPASSAAASSSSVGKRGDDDDDDGQKRARGRKFCGAAMCRV